MLETDLLHDESLLKQAVELAQELGNFLKARNILLRLAESCTGGMVAQTITSLPGSSAWFDCGLVTYSNQSKIALLNVLSQTLEMHGAVSEAVAKEMAQGCLTKIAPNKTQAYIAASITGIAGPDGGTAEKPVGTVCFAWAGLNLSSQKDLLIKTETKNFSGNRQQIRQQATVFMLKNLIEISG